MARNNNTEEPTAERNPLDILLESEGEAVEQANERAMAAQEEASRLYNEFITARDNGQAAMRTLLQGSQPRYNAERAERLRKAAIVQSFGDMATALARGVAAYGPRGAGYVPRTNTNSPLASIEEINRMREVYRQNKKAWDNQMLNFNLANERAKVQAAESLYTAAQERANTERERAEDAAQRRRERAAEAAMLGIRLNHEATENEKTRENARTIATIREGNERRPTTTDGNERRITPTDENNLVARIYLRLHPGSENVRTSTSPGPYGGDETTTTRERHTMASAAAAGYEDEATMAALRLMQDYNITIDEAIDAVIASREE